MIFTREHCVSISAADLIFLITVVDIGTNFQDRKRAETSWRHLIPERPYGFRDIDMINRHSGRLAKSQSIFYESCANSGLHFRRGFA